MIYYLKGKVLRKKEKYIVVLNNNIGYKVFVSKKTLENIQKEVELFCFLNVKEKGLDLYGFLTEKELEFFEVLAGVKGIGPKVALEIAAIGDLEKVKQRILDQDPTVFEGIPGLGAKRRASLILELSGKIREQSKRKTTEEEKALTSLGFSSEEAKKSLEKVDKNLEFDEKIKKALKILGQK